MTVLKAGGREMPSETKYTKEEVEAYEVALAMAASDMHFRFKMKRLAERCLQPKVGRALGNAFHIRVDEFGNPEILYNRTVIARFTLDGLRLSQENVSPYDKTVQNVFGSLVNLYTDYRFEYNLGKMQPMNIQQLAKDAGYERHGSMYSRLGDQCSVCQEYQEVFQEIERKTKELNKKYDEYCESLKINWKRGDEDPTVAFPLIPYKAEVEKSLPSFVERAYEDMRMKRGWNRKEK